MLPDIPRESSVACVSKSLRWWRQNGSDGDNGSIRVRDRVSLFLSLSGNRYSRLRKHLWRDLIVSVAARTPHMHVCKCTHLCACHVCARSCPHGLVCKRAAGHTHTRIKYYNLYARCMCVCVCVNKKEQREYVKGRMREEKRSMCWKLLETTRIGLAQLMNIDEPYPRHTPAWPRLDRSFPFENDHLPLQSTHRFIAFRRTTAAVVPPHSTCFSSR